MSLIQLVLGPIQRFLFSQREDFLQAGGCLVTGGVIRRPFSIRLAASDNDCGSIWRVSATFYVARDDGLGSRRTPLGVTLLEDL